MKVTLDAWRSKVNSGSTDLVLLKGLALFTSLTKVNGECDRKYNGKLKNV